MGETPKTALHRFKPGVALCFHNVRIHKEHWYGPVHLIFGRNNVNGEFWAMKRDE
ncbi:hypothetical protein [Moorena sp. SIO4G3]|uniref:hypothetical protein n=1 Tax=Moorena sp. SIO4G3 TaxID=2607821 RepID=UPI00142BB0B4|nr:hypothetical protein [Moorena sp. SIO4G3]NEO82109.1 hypothetical protein [Moorena sp. SIO4G3]